MKTLSGLVVCGGESSRMGKDKSILEYHGIPHRVYIYDLVTKFCGSAFLSLNQIQSENYSDHFPFIRDHDDYKGCGPMCALLSAWKEYPEASWLVIGCDYPFINERLILQLIANRKDKATCYKRRASNLHEPLLTIYESGFYPEVLDAFNKGNHSLSKLLSFSEVNAIEIENETDLRSVNTSEEYKSALSFIEAQRHNQI